MLPKGRIERHRLPYPVIVDDESYVTKIQKSEDPLLIIMTPLLFTLTICPNHYLQSTISEISETVTLTGSRMMSC